MHVTIMPKDIQCSWIILGLAQGNASIGCMSLGIQDAVSIFLVKVTASRITFSRSLLGEEHSLDVGEDTTLGNGNTGEEFVQFLVIADGELEVTGDDSGLLVVTGSVACKLEDLSS